MADIQKTIGLNVESGKAESQISKVIDKVKEIEKPVKLNVDDNIQNVEKHIKSVLDIIKELTNKEGKIKLSVEGIDKLQSSLTEMGSSLTTIDSSLSVLTKHFTGLRSSLDIKGDLDAQTKSLEKYKEQIDNVANSYSWSNSRILKRDPESFFGMDKWEKKVWNLNNDLLSGQNFATLTGGKGTGVLYDNGDDYSIILAQMTKLVSETGTFDHQIELANGKIVNMGDLFGKLKQNIINSFMAFNDKKNPIKSFTEGLALLNIPTSTATSLKVLNGYYSQLEKYKTLQDDLVTAQQREQSGAINVNIDKESISALSNAISELQKITSENAELSIKSGDIESITQSFTNLQTVLENIHSLLESLDIPKIKMPELKDDQNKPKQEHRQTTTRSVTTPNVSGGTTTVTHTNDNSVTTGGASGISDAIDGLNNLQSEMRETRQEAETTQQEINDIGKQDSGYKVDNRSLEEKLQLLKEIKNEYKFMETAEEKRIEMEEKAWDVGGNNPKSEADSQRKISQYESHVEHIDTATDKINEFEEAYQNIVITMKNGEKVVLSQFDDLVDTSLDKRRIKDIQFIPDLQEKSLTDLVSMMSELKSSSASSEDVIHSVSDAIVQLLNLDTSKFESFSNIMNSLNSDNPLLTDGTRNVQQTVDALNKLSKAPAELPFGKQVKKDLDEMNGWIENNVNRQMYPPTAYADGVDEIEAVIAKVSEFKSRLTEISESSDFSTLSSNMQGDVQNIIRWFTVLIDTENRVLEIQRQFDYQDQEPTKPVQEPTKPVQEPTIGTSQQEQVVGQAGKQIGEKISNSAELAKQKINDLLNSVLELKNQMGSPDPRGQGLARSFYDIDQIYGTGEVSDIREEIERYKKYKKAYNKNEQIAEQGALGTEHFIPTEDDLQAMKLRIASMMKSLKDEGVGYTSYLSSSEQKEFVPMYKQVSEAVEQWRSELSAIEEKNDGIRTKIDGIKQELIDTLSAFGEIDVSKIDDLLSIINNRNIEEKGMEEYVNKALNIPQKLSDETFSASETGSAEAVAESHERAAEAAEKHAEAAQKANEAETQTPQATTAPSEAQAESNEREAETAKKAADAERERANAAQEANAQQMSDGQSNGSASIDAETQSLTKLKSALESDIPNAINTKNKAFKAEQGIVDGVIEAEIGSLKTLSEQLNNIGTTIDDLSHTFESFGEGTGLSNFLNNIKDNEDALKSFSEILQKTKQEQMDAVENANLLKDNVTEEEQIDPNNWREYISGYDDLIEKLGTVVDIRKQIRVGEKDNKKYISYAIRGENGSAIIGQNGRLLRSTTDYDMGLKEQKESEKEYAADIKQQYNDAINAIKEYGNATTEVNNLQSDFLSGKTINEDQMTSALDRETEAAQKCAEALKTLYDLANNGDLTSEQFKNADKIANEVEDKILISQNRLNNTRTNAYNQSVNDAVSTFLKYGDKTIEKDMYNDFSSLSDVTLDRKAMLSLTDAELQNYTEASNLLEEILQKRRDGIELSTTEENALTKVTDLLQKKEQQYFDQQNKRYADLTMKKAIETNLNPEEEKELSKLRADYDYIEHMAGKKDNNLSVAAINSIAERRKADRDAAEEHIRLQQEMQDAEEEYTKEQAEQRARAQADYEKQQNEQQRKSREEYKSFWEGAMTQQDEEALKKELLYLDQREDMYQRERQLAIEKGQMDAEYQNTQNKQSRQEYEQFWIDSLNQRDARDKTISNFYDEQIEKINSLYEAKTKMNELDAQKISNPEIDQTAARAEAVEKLKQAYIDAADAKKLLEAIKDDITQEQYDNAMLKYDNAEKGSPVSQDKLNQANKQSDIKSATDEYKQQIKIIEEATEAMNRYNEMRRDDILGKSVISDEDRSSIIDNLEATAQAAELAIDRIKELNEQGKLTQEQMNKANEKYAQSEIGSNAKSIEEQVNKGIVQHDQTLEANWLKAETDSAKQAQDAIEKYYNAAQKVSELQMKLNSGENVGTQLAKAVEDMNKLQEAASNAMNTLYNLSDSGSNAVTDSLIGNSKELLDTANNIRLMSNDLNNNTLGFENIQRGYQSLINNAEKYAQIVEKQRTGKALTFNEISWLQKYGEYYRQATEEIGLFSEAQDKANEKMRAQFQESMVNAKDNVITRQYSQIGQMLSNLGGQEWNQDGVQKLEEIRQKYEGITDSVKNLHNATQEQKQALQGQMDALFQDLQGYSNNTKMYKNADQNSVSTLNRRMQEWVSKNSRATDFIPQIQQLQEKLNGGISVDGLNQVSAAFEDIKANATAANQVGMSFGDTLKKSFGGLARYLMTYASFYRVIGTLKQGLNIAKEMDTALMEVRKVSGESVSNLKDWQKSTFDQADSVGGSSKQIQESTAAWLRLGKSFTEAQEAAQASTKLLNVSEFTDINDATTSLLSITQAYKDLTYDDVIDKLNMVGDHYSSATDQLAQGLQNASAVLKTQGNDIDQALALLTAGNDVTQDISKTSAGIRTIALRISGTEEAKNEIAD